MKKIDKPTITQEDVCDSLSDLKYRERVIEKAQNYEEYFHELQLLLADEASMIGFDNEYKQHMVKMYSERFSNKNYDAYKIYSEIRNAQPNCPYCNFLSRSVRQLDHYFPKTIFPSLAITPSNLVPICTDCNKLKRDYYSVEKQEMLIHPYFDDFKNESFGYIKCKIIESKKIGFIFFINKLESWNDCIHSRIKLQFEKLNLNNLYRTDFEANFCSFFYEMKEVYSECGINNVKKIIERRMRSYKQSDNTPWLYAGYEVILSSEWFLNEYLPKNCFD